MGECKEQMTPTTKGAKSLLERISRKKTPQAEDPQEIAQSFADKLDELNDILEKMLAIKDKDLKTEGKAKEDENKKKMNYLEMARNSLEVMVRCSEGYSKF